MGLLESEEYNIIIIYIDYLTKIRHFIAIKNDVFAQDTAHLCYDHTRIRGTGTSCYTDHSITCHAATRSAHCAQ